MELTMEVIQGHQDLVIESGGGKEDDMGKEMSSWKL